MPTLDNLRADKAIVIKINGLYHNNMTDEELYNAVRWCWRLNCRNANHQGGFIVAVAGQTIVAVYKNVVWHRISDLDDETYKHIRPQHDHSRTKQNNRSYFTCDKVNGSFGIQNHQYIGERLPDAFCRPGISNPVLYAANFT